MILNDYPVLQPFRFMLVRRLKKDIAQILHNNTKLLELLGLPPIKDGGGYNLEHVHSRSVKISDYTITGLADKVNEC